MLKCARFSSADGRRTLQVVSGFKRRESLMVMDDVSTASSIPAAWALERKVAKPYTHPLPCLLLSLAHSLPLSLSLALSLSRAPSLSLSTLNSKPVTLDLNSQPKTRNSKPETRNPKPETRNLKPETRNPKPETRNPNPNPKPQTPDPKP